MSIKRRPEGECPREKLLERGVGVSSDAELLAILLRVGVRGVSAVDLAYCLLSGFGSLGKLMNADIKSLSSYRGMGITSFTQPVVIREIGRRILSEELRENTIFNNPQTVADYLRLNLGRERVEVSYALFLNQQNQLIVMRELSRGMVAKSAVCIREIVKLTLDEYADSLIIAHDHPDGSVGPSEADIGFTRRLAQALDLVDVSLFDHFIVAAKEVCSLRETGYMD